MKGDRKEASSGQVAQSPRISSMIHSLLKLKALKNMKQQKRKD